MTKYIQISLCPVNFSWAKKVASFTSTGSEAFHSIRRKFLCVSIVAVFGVILPDMVHAQNNENKEVTKNLEKKGKQFRAEVESAFLKMSKEDARRTYDLAEICNKYFPAGMPFDDVKVILVSAGTLATKSGIVFVPVYNRSFPPDSPDRGDIGSGFSLEKSLMSNAIFDINFRPSSSNKTKVGKVMSCGVISTSL